MKPNGSSEPLRETLPNLRSDWPVVLVGMPFMDARRPSIQLGLLKALATKMDFIREPPRQSRFRDQIGLDYYQLLSEHRGNLLGEWLFSLDAFPSDSPDPDSKMLDELGDDLSYLPGSHEGLRKTNSYTLLTCSSISGRARRFLSMARSHCRRFHFDLPAKYSVLCACQTIERATSSDLHSIWRC